VLRASGKARTYKVNWGGQADEGKSGESQHGSRGLRGSVRIISLGKLKKHLRSEKANLGKYEKGKKKRNRKPIVI